MPLFMAAGHVENWSSQGAFGPPSLPSVYKLRVQADPELDVHVKRSCISRDFLVISRVDAPRAVTGGSAEACVLAWSRPGPSTPECLQERWRRAGRWASVYPRERALVSICEWSNCRLSAQHDHFTRRRCILRLERIFSVQSGDVLRLCAATRWPLNERLGLK